MNIKLVKLTVEYKKQLTDMMDEWLAVEKDFSPYPYRKNGFRPLDEQLLSRSEEHTSELQSHA